MSTGTPLPDTVSANLDARLAPFSSHGDGRGPSAHSLEDREIEASRAVTPQPDRRLRLGLVKDLKLLFAALGAGNSVVPLGDNSRAARLLSEYANALRAS